MKQGAHINQLEIENTKRVRAVTITPAETGLTVIGGNNNQGKTSVLDAIAWALGGERFRPDNPMRDGANTPPRLRVTLSNGCVGERSGKNATRKVTDPTGKRAGQQLLNSFVEELALNLPKFMQASDKEKADTLLRIIGGLETPTSGAMAVDGSPVSFDETSLRAYRATLGFVFQDGGLFHHMTALENVALPLQVVHGASSDEADDRARELLARLGLEDSLAKRPAQLSGGQKQRVAIARALATDPQVLLCDEATSALDPNTTRSILALLQDINRDLGVTIIVITHEMKVVEQICNRVAVLDDLHLMRYDDYRYAHLLVYLLEERED
mgnify:CR=1 FL=1